MTTIYPADSTLSDAVAFAQPYDHAQMAAIYNHYVKNSAATFATRTVTEAEWQARLAATGAAYPQLVYGSGGSGGNARGYALATRYRSRSGYDWSAEVSVYVAPDASGQGIGKALLLDLVRLLAGQGYRSLVGVITLPNAASERLHEALGFRRFGLLPEAGFKLGAWHDLSFHQLSLPKPPADQPLWPPMTITALKSQPTQVAIEQPDHPDIQLFIRTLDAFHDGLYPPEHNYHESVATLEDSDSVVFIARKGLMAVGMAALKPFADYGELKRMYVDRLFRGAGIAKALLESVEKEARHRGLKALKLETGDKQAPAIQLYEKCGFERTGKFGDYEDHGTNVFMHKTLSR